MFLFDRRRSEMVTKANALPGRSEALPTAERHFLSGLPLKSPVPAGMAEAMFGMGCFWGVERKFAGLPGVWLTMVGYAAGITPNPTYRETCTQMTGHNEVVRVIYDPAIVSYEALLKVFWEGHDPTQGMRQGNDMVNLSVRHLHLYAGAGRGGRGEPGDVSGGLEGAGVRGDHDRDLGRPGVLLCRGLPSAISGEEPGWLLRDRRDGGFVPDRVEGRGGLNA